MTMAPSRPSAKEARFARLARRACAQWQVPSRAAAHGSGSESSVRGLAEHSKQEELQSFAGNLPAYEVIGHRQLAGCMEAQAGVRQLGGSQARAQIRSLE